MDMQRESVNLTSDNKLDSILDLMHMLEIEDATEKIPEPPKLTRGDAEYYIKRYKALLKEEEELEAHANSEIEKAKAWLELELNRRAKTKQYLLTALQNFAEQELEGSKSRSIRLIQGNLAFRKAQPTLEYDEKELIKRLPEDYLQYNEPTIKLSELKKAGKIVGEEFYLGDEKLSGVTVVHRPDSFSIK